MDGRDEEWLRPDGCDGAGVGFTVWDGVGVGLQTCAG